jgi:hypothetical protein
MAMMPVEPMKSVYPSAGCCFEYIAAMTPPLPGRCSSTTV